MPRSFFIGFLSITISLVYAIEKKSGSEIISSEEFIQRDDKSISSLKNRGEAFRKMRIRHLSQIGVRDRILHSSQKRIFILAEHGEHIHVYKRIIDVSDQEEEDSVETNSQTSIISEHSAHSIIRKLKKIKYTQSSSSEEDNEENLIG